MSRHDGVYELGAVCPDCSERFVVRATVIGGRAVFLSHEHGGVRVVDRSTRRSVRVFRDFVQWLDGPASVPVPAPWRAVALQ